MSDSIKYCVTAIVCVLIISGVYVFVNHGKDDERARCDLSVEQSSQQDEDTLQARWDAMTPEERQQFQSNSAELSKSVAALDEAVATVTSSLSRSRTNSVPTIEMAKMPEIFSSDLGPSDSVMSNIDLR